MRAATITLKQASTIAEIRMLRDLLQHCTNVKTVRLCLQFGRELSLPLPHGPTRPLDRDHR